MSEKTILVLRPGLFSGEQTPSALEQTLQQAATTEFKIDIKTMTSSDWDQALQAILDHDCCITL